VNRRWATLIGLVVAAFAIVPLATAGAQAPPTTAGSAGVTIEGSAPPGGTVNCETAPTLDPDHGPPGTEVTATAEFVGNCDDLAFFFLKGMTCTGTVSGGDLPEDISFPVTVSIGKGNATVSGTFTAPAFAPEPPVVDAVEDLAVTITCNIPSEQVSPAEAAPEGNLGTTYVYPPANYGLELFADPDGDQPTLVNGDQVDLPGVVNATPTFTG
jgi:hypothetical protein